MFRNLFLNPLDNNSRTYLLDPLMEAIISPEKITVSSTDIEKQKYFLYGTTFEKMAYAYQFVKDRNSTDYKFKSPSDIVMYLMKIPGVEVDDRFRKYISVY